MISAQEARSIILSAVREAGSITLSLERSLGRVLAEDISAGEDIPSFDNSAMDGFAVRAEDVRNVPVELQVIGEIAAGAAGQAVLAKSQAMRIMTGARIPEGCDSVIPQEWTESKNSNVNILKSAVAGNNIRKAGADMRRGEVALKKHQPLRPQEIGVLASLGKRFVEVYRPLSVAILATGNEIVDIASRPPEGKIRNSNAYALSALVKDAGCEPVMLGIASDDVSELKEKIAKGLLSDVLITTGGVSVGKYDLVIESMKSTGVEVKFWKINIKPGMPMMFGMHGTKPVFSLPGNPVSSMVTFLQFVAPALQKMMGAEDGGGVTRLPAQIQHEISKSDGKRHFVRGMLTQQNGTLVVRSTGSQVSNILSSLIKANCLIILPEDVTRVQEGDVVEVELL